MKEKKVIAFKNQKRKMPIFPTLTLALALDRWNAPGWLWGACGLVVLIAWGSFFYELATYEEKEVDIFNDKPAATGSGK